MNAVLQALKVHPVFKSLWIGTLQTLEKNSSILELPKGSIVYQQGDKADAMYVVISGRLQAVVANGKSGDHVTAIYGPDSTFGERALFTGDPHWNTVSVVTDARVVRLDIESVKRALQRSSFLSHELALRMGQHIRKTFLSPKSHHNAHIAALASVSPIVNMSVLVGEIADMLNMETGRSVLILHVAHDHGHPALSDLTNQPISHSLILSWLEKVEHIGERVKRLTTHMGNTALEAARVAPLLGHLSSHYDELLVLCDSRTSCPAMFEFLLQSDESYVLMQPDDHEYQQARQVILLLRTQSERGTHARIRPIVCVDRGKQSPAISEVQEKLGQEPHMMIKDTPKPNDTIGGQSSPSHKSHLRTLAREIGHCRVGLALSSGGARGFAHVGVIQVLEEHGLHIDAVAGTSMGAMVGSLWCYGLNGKQLEEVAMRLQQPRILFKIIDPVFPPRIGFMKGGYIKKVMHGEMGDAEFKDLVRTFKAVATDIDTLEKVVIDRGPVWKAVQASSSLPAIIVPYRHMDRNLVDGGVCDPLPVDVLQNMGIEKIIAVNTIQNPEDILSCRISQAETEKENNRRSRRKKNSVINKRINYFATGNILDIIFKSVQGSGCRLAEYAGQQADIVLKPILCESTFYDFQHPDRYIAVGRSAAEEHINEILELFKPFNGPSVTENANYEAIHSK